MDRSLLRQERKNILTSSFENTLRIRLLIVFSTIGLAAIVFYFIQNTAQLAGGSIALPKLIWLAYAILFWFCLPLLFITDKRLTSKWKIFFIIFLINMLLRAVIELLMMYITSNWSPYYGIGHDVFTIFLLSTLLFINRDKIQRDILFGYTITILLMFVIEIGFVFYMLANVVGDDAVVYFVPDAGKHTSILSITWLVVVMLTGYIFVFTRRWLRGEFIRTSG